MRRYFCCIALVALGCLTSLTLSAGTANANESASTPAVVAQSTSSPAPAAADDIADLRAQMEVMKAKLDLLEAEQEQQAKIASDLTTQQADSAAKIKKNNALSVHVADTGTNVRLYGLIEPTLISGTNFSKTGGSSLGIPVSWFSGNRWGLDLDQKLGSNLEGRPQPDSRIDLIAKLESEFELASGNMDTPGVLFNRDAWVGMQSVDFGKLTVGRQDTLPRDVAANWGDPYGNSALTTNEGNFTNVNNFKQLIFYMSGGNGAGGQGDTRYDSAIVWKRVSKRGLFLAAAYNFGDANGPGGPNGSGPIPGGEFNHGSSAALGVGLNAGYFHPNIFYTTSNVLAAKTIGSTNVGYQDQSLGFGGAYDLGRYRLNAGYITYTGDQGSLGQRKDQAWTTSFKFTPTKYTDYEVGLQEFYAHNAAVSAAGYVLRPFVDYTGAISTISGTRFTAYGSVMLHPVPTIDVYLAGDDLLTGGGYLDSRANGFKHQVETATGVRYRF